LQNNDRTSLYFTLLKPNKNKIEWVGIDPRASHADTRDITVRRSMHAFETLSQTVQCGGVKNIEINPLHWMNGRPYQDFEVQKPYVLIVPGCAPTRPEKRWVSARYAELTERLDKKGYHSVLLGTEAEQDITHEIQTLSRAQNFINLTGQTSLDDLASLGRDAAFAIGNDTGPMHIIGPGGCPCLVLYPESSNPVRYRPLGKIVKTIQKPQMQDISVDDVWDQFLAMESEVQQ
jgi:ADP-heptose:LPS heptosyltransferase